MNRENDMISAHKALVFSAVAAMLLGGCGGSSDGKANEGEPPMPKTVEVTVMLEETAPLEVLFNADGKTCSSVNIGQVLEDAMANGGEAEPEPVKVTLRNAEGAIVGTETLPKHGGTFSGGCTWPVDFGPVKASDFYEATVTVGSLEKSGNGKTVDGVADVQVAL